jgi:hypothetical protein
MESETGGARTWEEADAERRVKRGPGVFSLT